MGTGPDRWRAAYPLKVERLLHQAEEVSLISRSIDSEVILEPEVHLREQGTAAR